MRNIGHHLRTSRAAPCMSNRLSFVSLYNLSWLLFSTPCAWATCYIISHTSRARTPYTRDIMHTRLRLRSTQIRWPYATAGNSRSVDTRAADTGGNGWHLIDRGDGRGNLHGMEATSAECHTQLRNDWYKALDGLKHVMQQQRGDDLHVSIRNLVNATSSLCSYTKDRRATSLEHWGVNSWRHTCAEESLLIISEQRVSLIWTVYCG